MKHLNLSSSLLTGVAILLCGCSTPKDESDVSHACPPGTTIQGSRTLHAEGMNSLLGSGWIKAATVSPAKFPSGIETHYKIHRRDDLAAGDHRLELRFSKVEGTPAMAHIYGFDGAIVLGNGPTLYALSSGKANGVQLLVKANPEGGGGLAVLTCQNQKKSVIAIDIPAP